jgi:hypothetical protein
MSEPTICARCRYYIGDSIRGYICYEPARCWHGCRKVEKVDFVSGQKSYPWDTYPVECGQKNNGECPDYEYKPQTLSAGQGVCVIEEPKKHWWQR